MPWNRASLPDFAPPKLRRCARGSSAAPEYPDARISRIEDINASTPLTPAAGKPCGGQRQAIYPLIPLLQGGIVEAKGPIADRIDGGEEIDDGVVSNEGRVLWLYAS